jgi:cytochrome c biogenesis protein CcdA
MGLEQPSLLIVAYATGVLMFFAPCSVGLLPAYLTYFNTHSEGRAAIIPSEATRHRFRWPARILGILGAILFLAGAIPLFYMAVAGLRILLPGYQIIVPLAQTASGSYLPSVALVTVGTLILLQGLVLVTGLSGLYFGFITTLGVISTYLVIGLPVVAIGQWVRPYLFQLQLLAGPMIIALGLLYYKGKSLPTSIRLPARTSSSTGTFFSFGILYGIGSLACNLPVFLGVILSVFTTDGIIGGLAVFGAFALGMGTLMIGVSVLTAVTGRSYSLGRYAHRVRTFGSLGFILIGGYVTWYTLTAFGYL